VWILDQQDWREAQDSAFPKKATLMLSSVDFCIARLYCMKGKRMEFHLGRS
jgi:hypothetical protein